MNKTTKTTIALGTTLIGVVGLGVTANASTDVPNVSNDNGTTQQNCQQNNLEGHEYNLKTGNTSNSTVNPIYNYYKTGQVQVNNNYVKNVSSPIYDYYQSQLNTINDSGNNFYDNLANNNIEGNNFNNNLANNNIEGNSFNGNLANNIGDNNFNGNLANNQNFNNIKESNVNNAQNFNRSGLDQTHNTVIQSNTNISNPQTHEDPVGYERSEGHWPKNTATVYVKATNPLIRSAVNSAISNWNNTGSFTFVPTNDPANANIVVQEDYNPTTSADGVTYTKINRLSNEFTGQQNVYLNDFYLLNPDAGYTQESRVHAATHELGHAIGLGHNPVEKSSIMYPSNTGTPIQINDVRAVNAIYR